MHNIKRNKRIAEYLQKQLKRLKMHDSLTLFFERYIISDLGTQDSIELSSKIITEIEPDIFDNDTVLIETLKIIGLMEVSKDEKELDKLIEKRDKVKEKKKEHTDFDQILKGIMKVPNDKKATK